MKKKKRNSILRKISFLIAILMLAVSMPHTIQALTAQTSENIVEVEEYREEYTKHFFLNLSNVELFIYLGCETAIGEESIENDICKATLSAGAKYVIGWKQKISPSDAIKWINLFQQKLLDGKTIEEAFASSKPSALSDGFYEYPAKMGSAELYRHESIKSLGNMCIK